MHDGKFLKKKKAKQSVQLATFRRWTNFVVRFVKNVRKKKTVIRQHNNARSHTARLTLQTIQKNDWELLSHPTYSPDLPPTPTPQDNDLLGPLEDHMRGHAKLVARS
jgi:hypothetical protein